MQYTTAARFDGVQARSTGDDAGRATAKTGRWVQCRGPRHARAQWYDAAMSVAHLSPDERVRWEHLTDEQRAFVGEKEPLWRRAHEIAAENPGIDASDVYHVL